jgi:hypothetical protein
LSYDSSSQKIAMETGLGLFAGSAHILAHQSVPNLPMACRTQHRVWLE